MPSRGKGTTTRIQCIKTLRSHIHMVVEVEAKSLTSGMCLMCLCTGERDISKIRQKLRRLPRRQLIAQNAIGCSRADGQFRADAGAYNLSQFSLTVAAARTCNSNIVLCHPHSLNTCVNVRQSTSSFQGSYKGQSSPTGLPRLFIRGVPFPLLRKLSLVRSAARPP